MFHIFTLKYTNVSACDFFLSLLVTHNLVPLCFHSNLHWQMQGEGLRGPVPALLCGGKKTEPSQRDKNQRKLPRSVEPMSSSPGKNQEHTGWGTTTPLLLPSHCRPTLQISVKPNCTKVA